MAALGAILTSILTLGNVQFFSRHHRYYVDFTNVEALPPKAAVKVAGVEIGKVRKISLVDGRARVTIAVDPEIPIYANAVARVGSTGIIGTKFIELMPGSPQTGVLASEGTIRGENGGSSGRHILQPDHLPPAVQLKKCSEDRGKNNSHDSQVPTWRLTVVIGHHTT